ncbi:MAG: hypothetical protein ACP6IU_02675 [Candidatus Asgardarchaeia archaeon]|nr:hypothetical protein [Candidatus Odinarchaeota archaeon]
MMPQEQLPFYWLLNFKLYDYKFPVGNMQTELSGTILIISRQLWSLMKEEQIRSAVIGPGIVRGTTIIKDTVIEIVNPIAAVIFDPTQMRFDEPIPVVDIINPEVVDPLAKGKKEEFERVIMEVYSAAGNVLIPQKTKLAEVKPPGSVPRVYYEEEVVKTVNVNYISGRLRTKFILGGRYNILYRPLKQRFMEHKYSDITQQKIFYADRGEIRDVKKEELEDWIIVEKLQGYLGDTPPDGYTLLKDEYDNIVSFVESKKDEFLI